MQRNLAFCVPICTRTQMNRLAEQSIYNWRKEMVWDKSKSTDWGFCAVSNYARLQACKTTEAETSQICAILAFSLLSFYATKFSFLELSSFSIFHHCHLLLPHFCVECKNLVLWLCLIVCHWNVTRILSLLISFAWLSTAPAPTQCLQNLNFVSTFQLTFVRVCHCPCGGRGYDFLLYLVLKIRIRSLIEYFAAGLKLGWLM